MKRASVLLVFVFVFLMSAVCFAQTTPGDPPPPKPAEHGVSGFGLFVNIGPSFHFLDLDQFDEDLDVVGVGHFRPTQRFDFEGSVGLDIHWRQNGLRVGMGWGNWQMIQQDNARYAEFSDSSFAFDVAYKRRLGKHVNLLAGSWLGWGGYEYDLHSPRLQALEKQAYLFAAPELAMDVIFTSIGFGVAGQYRIAQEIDAIDYGDFRDVERDDFDLDRFVLRVYLIFGFWRDKG